MSVLIKGMNMPQSCDECPCCSYDDIEEIYRCNYVDDIVPNAINYKLDECPIVEVPDIPTQSLGDLLDVMGVIFKNFADNIKTKEGAE